MEGFDIGVIMLLVFRDDRVHAELEAWQLEFESSLLTTNARVMKPTGMVQGGKKVSTQLS